MRTALTLHFPSLFCSLSFFRAAFALHLATLLFRLPVECATFALCFPAVQLRLSLELARFALHLATLFVPGFVLVLVKSRKHDAGLAVSQPC